MQGDVVYYTDQNLVQNAQLEGNSNEYELANAENKFIHFIREHQHQGTFKYRDQLRSNSQRQKYFLRVDMSDLLAFDDQLSSQLRNSPTDYLKRFECAIGTIYHNDYYDESDPSLELKPKFQV